MSSQAAVLQMPAAVERRIDAAEAARRADGFLARNLGNLLMAGTPRRVIFPLRSAWVVPVELTYPGYGSVGEVGDVIVDEGTGEIVAWTSPEEMRQATERLYREHEPEILAAFQRLQSGST